MQIDFELTVQESLTRQLSALWNGGFGANVLRSALPQIEALAKAHYLEIAKSGKVRSDDPGLGIESFAMFNDLTKPIIQDDSIILDTSLDYALEQEERLRASSGRSFLPDEKDIAAIVANIITNGFN
jgi:hypothetical protein